MNILGISAFYHDSAACLVRDGEIIAAAQEERFTRKKHDSRFPKNAIKYCLKEGGLQAKDLDFVGFYDKPLLKFERILETYGTFAPKGLKSFLMAMPLWLKGKLFTSDLIKRELDCDVPVLFTEHHHSHAASAFYPSPFREAAIATLDGVGEWCTTSYGVGRNNKITLLKELSFPHSLGMLYSAFTYYTGFKVNSGEYKVMGLAPYGQPKYVSTIYDKLIDVKEDGSFWMNMEYFDYCAGLTMTNEKFHELFDGPPREPETKLTQKEMDLARSIQVVTEEILLKIVRHIHKETSMENLCLAGGVALNCVANSRILREGPFKNIWIQPAAGDAGGALGTALAIWYDRFNNPREADGVKDFQKGSYLGPSYTEEEIKEYLDRNGIVYERLDRTEMVKRVAKLLTQEKVIGFFQGRMEFGPRALGARSIIGDARSPKMQSIMNLKIKFRESFRPFAPSVLADKVHEWFEFDRESPYMLLVARVKKERCREMTEAEKNLWGIDQLNVVRSEIPAITHIDYSARLQTVNRETNPYYYDLINEFYSLTGCPVIVNTSFNVRGEPIVESPHDAYMCFMRTHIDYLVLECFLLDKKKMKPLEKDIDWKKEFELD